MEYRDREGKTISLMEWADKYEDFAYKSVGADDVGEVTVQTVWCGHWDDPVAPMYGTALLYAESRKMIREVANPALTDEDALAFHQQVVQEMQEKKGGEAG